jgi:heme A synthase
MIEFTHRLTSGLALLLTVGLVIWAVRCHPSGGRVRKSAWTTLGFMVAEALLGAGLVIFGLVAEDDSVARAIVICAHLLNTLALLGFMAITAWWADRPGRLNLDQPVARWVAISISGVFLIGVTGAIAALGDTLFPAASLAEGLAADTAQGAHFLLRLRGLHPILAVAVGTGLLYLGRHLRQQPHLRTAATLLMALVCIQIVVGFTNLAMLVPVYLQLIHLFLADAVWIVLVVLGASSLEQAA